MSEDERSHGLRRTKVSAWVKPLLGHGTRLARRMLAEAPPWREGRVTDVDSPKLPWGFRLRRFAGHARHAEQLATPLRIVHLTDQHVGRVTSMRVQEAAVRLANAQSPDLVVVTGDFVCHSQDYLDALEALMRRFEAPVVGVLGNHDHWSGAREVRGALRRAGVELLDNAHTTLTLRGQQLQVVGLDDAYTGHADLTKATKGLRRNVATLGLSHIAEEADALWARGVPLVLSGHTHAGQVTLAGLHELALGRLVGHRYVHGLYGTRDAAPNRGALYVGAGIGASVMPLRLGERGQREVAVFELGLAPGGFEEHHEEQAALPGRAPSAETKRRRAQAVLRKQARIDGRLRR
jgi:predicted MPP superfamily phosphohydrolase